MWSLNENLYKIIYKVPSHTYISIIWAINIIIRIENKWMIWVECLKNMNKNIFQNSYLIPAVMWKKKEENLSTISWNLKTIFQIDRLNHALLQLFRMEQKENVKHKLKTEVTPTTTFFQKKFFFQNCQKVSCVDNYENLIALAISDQSIWKLMNLFPILSEVTYIFMAHYKDHELWGFLTVIAWWIRYF